MFKLRQTWVDFLSARKLYALDVRVNQKDPAWPVVPLAADAPEPKSPGSIHVNPKFLQTSNTGQQPSVSIEQIVCVLVGVLCFSIVLMLWSCTGLFNLGITCFIFGSRISAVIEHSCCVIVSALRSGGITEEMVKLHVSLFWVYLVRVVLSILSVSQVQYWFMLCRLLLMLIYKPKLPRKSESLNSCSSKLSWQSWPRLKLN